MAKKKKRNIIVEAAKETMKEEVAKLPKLKLREYKAPKLSSKSLTQTSSRTRSDIKATRRMLSGNQQILNGMFGGGMGRRVLGDTRPRILNTLQGGKKPFGLIKNQDDGYTSSLFLPQRGRHGRI